MRKGQFSLARRWVIECTFVRLGRTRRLAWKFGGPAASINAFIYVGAVMLLPRRMARSA